MRIFIFLLLALPSVTFSQINRSAKRLAAENIQEYLANNLFKDRSYTPVSYSELQLREEKDRRVDWSISHKFEIAETETVSGKKTIVQKLYHFSFYLDKKMNVVRAEGYYVD